MKEGDPKTAESDRNKDANNDFHNRNFFNSLSTSFLFRQQSHEIHDLEIYTQYLISIQVFNPEGVGPPTAVVVMTDEGGE